MMLLMHAVHVEGTFDDIEISNYNGSPIVLYEFKRTSGGVDYFWRYNTSDIDITYNGNVFTATTISDDGVRQNGEATSSQLTVSMPATNTFPQMFRNSGSTPSDAVWLTVYRTHYNLAEARVIWVGSVASMSQVDEAKIQIVCNMLVASFKRGGLRKAWSRTCPHTLYDTDCRADPEDFTVTGTVSALTGNTVSATALASVPDLYFDGGYIEWALVSGVIERRWVKTHVGNTVTIAGSTFGIIVGQAISAVAGCDHTSATCQSKFNNLANNGSFQNMPGKSPFSGDPIF